MSLWYQRRRILRAVSGDLSPAEESNLRAHLRGCHVCRAFYDLTSAAAAGLGATGADVRERQRILAALTPTAMPAVASAPRRRWAIRLAPALLVAAAAGVALWFLPARTPGGVAWRGGGDEARSPVRLLLHASRKGQEGAPPGPLRFIADLPAAGEGRVSTRDYLQLSYVGLRAPAYAMVVAIDESGAEHQYVPRPDAEPSRVEPSERARGLGPSVYLGRQRPGRFRVFGVFADAPLDARAIREAAGRAAAHGKPASLEGVKGVAVSGVLIVEP
jgi:hypothetical protein